MTQAVKTYKILLDDKTTLSDKNIVVNIGDMFQFHDNRDLIHLRSESYIDEFFEKENPTIDFEKYRFKPDSSLSGLDFYFYRQSATTLNPISYDDSLPPEWVTTNPVYSMSSGFNVDDIPNSILFLDSYFKFDFFLDPISQKSLFSVTLPLDGTMLQNDIVPRPNIDFNGQIITELEYVYWLRNPQQLMSFTGNTFDLYCVISFFNSKTGIVTNFKRNNLLPNNNAFLRTHTMLDKYIMYRLDYSNLTYKILQPNGQPFSGNRIKLYSL